MTTADKRRTAAAVERLVCADEVGRLVRDEVTGRTGILMAVLDYEDGSRYPRTRERLAFLRPERGGREWTASPDRVTVIGRVVPDQEEKT
jgi:hypothetical protein